MCVWCIASVVLVRIEWILGCRWQHQKSSKYFQFSRERLAQSGIFFQPKTICTSREIIPQNFKSLRSAVLESWQTNKHIDRHMNWLTSYGFRGQIKQNLLTQVTRLITCRVRNYFENEAKTFEVIDLIYLKNWVLEVSIFPKKTVWKPFPPLEI